MASRRHRFERVQPLALGLAAVLFSLVIGWIDAQTGDELSLWVLYILPIAVVAWFVSGRVGLVMGLLAGVLVLSTYLTGAFAQAGSTSLWVAGWELGSVLMVFGLTAAASAKVRRVLLEHRRLARRDALTRVPNLLSFTEHLAEELQEAARRRMPMTLGIVEVHGIAYVNDRFGTQAGDVLLRATAVALRDSAGSDDLVGRISGTSFGVVLPGRRAESAKTLLEGMREEVLRQIGLYDRPISLAIAAVSTDRPSRDAQSLLDRASWLLQTIKQDRTLHPFRVMSEQEVEV